MVKCCFRRWQDVAETLVMWQEARKEKESTGCCHSRSHDRVAWLSFSQGKATNLMYSSHMRSECHAWQFSVKRAEIGRRERVWESVGKEQTHAPRKIHAICYVLCASSGSFNFDGGAARMLRLGISKWQTSIYTIYFIKSNICLSSPLPHSPPIDVCIFPVLLTNWWNNFRSV